MKIFARKTGNGKLEIKGETDPFYYVSRIEGKVIHLSTRASPPLQASEIHRVVFEFPNHPVLHVGDNLQLSVTLTIGDELKEPNEDRDDS